MKKHKNRPFALIGVNSDRTNEAKGLANYRKQAEKMGVTWRSFQDEGNSPRISEDWHVQGWPTLYYIDHKGIIRHKNVRDEAEMDRVLEEMIAAAEKDAK